VTTYCEKILSSSAPKNIIVTDTSR